MALHRLTCEWACEVCLPAKGYDPETALAVRPNPFSVDACGFDTAYAQADLPVSAQHVHLLAKATTQRRRWRCGGHNGALACCMASHSMLPALQAVQQQC